MTDKTEQELIEEILALSKEIRKANQKIRHASKFIPKRRAKRIIRTAPLPVGQEYLDGPVFICDECGKTYEQYSAREWQKDDTWPLLILCIDCYTKAISPHKHILQALKKMFPGREQFGSDAPSKRRVSVVPGRKKYLVLMKIRRPKNITSLQ